MGFWCKTILKNTRDYLMVKKVLRAVLVFFYLFSTMALAVTVIKPGAAIFFKEFDLQSEEIYINDGLIEYHLRLAQSHYDFDSLVVREDGQILHQIGADELSSAVSGAITLVEPSEDSVKVLINPISPTSQIEDSQSFEILVRPNFISSVWVKISFLTLLIGLLFLIASIIINDQKRKTVFGSVLGLYKLWDQGNQDNLNINSKLRILRYSAINVTTFSFIYVFMEWLFFVTKISFMDVLSFFEKLGVLFNSGFFISLFMWFVVIVLFLIDLFFTISFTSLHRFIYHLPAAFLVTCLGLILVDNFTYTVFGFGVVTSNTIGKIIYILFFVGLFLYVSWELDKRYLKERNRGNRWWQIIPSLCLIVVVIISIFLSFNPVKNTMDEFDETGKTSNFPNIILLGNDGLNAENMSVYGYERETTPFLEELAKTSLVMENNFVNANKSTGSDTAMLTGKLPFDTRVLFPPNTLQGEDMYEHLPGILKRYGYKTASFAVGHYLDVDVINFKNAFDLVGEKANEVPMIVDKAALFGYSDMIYFNSMIVERIQDRIQHVFFIKEMENPYEKITKDPNSYLTSDSRNMSNLISSLETATNNNQPLFAHIHLISTHGGKFDPSFQKFSIGQEQLDSWMVDFYDDAILNYDQIIKEFVQYLQDKEVFDKTIIVFYSDHGSQWTIEDKTPLIIHFPNDQHSGSVTESTQNLDIAPTVLDYLEIEIPDWMFGESLLKDLDETRLIYSAELKREIEDNEISGINPNKIVPPFYQFGYIDVIQCQKFHKIDLQELTMESKEIENHTTPCLESTLYTQDEIWEKAGELLHSFGYELPDDW